MGAKHTLKNIHHFDHGIGSMLYRPEGVDGFTRLDRGSQEAVIAYHCRIENILAARLAGAVHKSPGNRWSYIPLSNLRFMQCLGDVQGKTFIDVGCGLGLKCWLARKRKDYLATGIDIGHKYIDLAKEIFCGESGLDFVCCDALQYEDYGEFDVVYTYDPLTKAMTELVSRIADKMKPGAYFIRPFGFGCDLLRGFQNISSGVWRKPN